MEKLFQVLKKKKDEMKVEAYAREEDLSRMIKYCTKVVSDYEMKTEEMIKLLHNTRDEQVLILLLVLYCIILEMKRYFITVTMLHNTRDKQEFYCCYNTA